jgi:hypothetical protein
MDYHHDYCGCGRTILEAVQDLRLHLESHNEDIIRQNNYNSNITLLVQHHDINDHLMVNVIPRVHYDGALTIRLNSYGYDLTHTFTRKNDTLKSYIDKVDKHNKWYLEQNLKLPEFKVLAK